MRRMVRQLWREVSIVREYGRLVCRTPRKFLQQARRDYSLRFSGFAPGWQAANLACRIIDDIADGERRLIPGFASFPALITQIRGQIIDRTPMTGSLLLELLEEAITVVERRDRRAGETRESFVGLLDAMLVEYQRRIERRVLPKQTLIEIHIASSVHPLNLSLICLGSRTRTAKVPALAEFIGRMGVLRDLERELGMGIINIPREVLPENACVDQLIARPRSIRRMESVTDWIRAEARDGLELAEQVRNSRLDPLARRVTQNQIQLYLRYAQQQFPPLTAEAGRS
jgi:hypothetical protein